MMQNLGLKRLSRAAIPLLLLFCCETYASKAFTSPYDKSPDDYKEEIALVKDLQSFAGKDYLAVWDEIDHEASTVGLEAITKFWRLYTDVRNPAYDFRESILILLYHYRHNHFFPKERAPYKMEDILNVFFLTPHFKRIAIKAFREATTQRRSFSPSLWGTKHKRGGFTDHELRGLREQALLAEQQKRVGIIQDRHFYSLQTCRIPQECALKGLLAKLEEDKQPQKGGYSIQLDGKCKPKIVANIFEQLDSRDVLTLEPFASNEADLYAALDFLTFLGIDRRRVDASPLDGILNARRHAFWMDLNKDHGLYWKMKKVEKRFVEGLPNPFRDTRGMHLGEIIDDEIIGLSEDAAYKVERIFDPRLMPWRPKENTVRLKIFLEYVADSKGKAQPHRIAINEGSYVGSHKSTILLPQEVVDRAREILDLVQVYPKPASSPDVERAEKKR